YQLQRTLLDARPREPLVGGHVIDVELQRVSARLLDQTRVFDPPSGRDAIQTGNDGNTRPCLGTPQMLEVFIRRQPEVVRLGVVAGRLPVATVGTYVQIAIQDVAFELDLFLEQRVQDDGRGAGVFHPANGVEIARQGRSGRHQR